LAAICHHIQLKSTEVLAISINRKLNYREVVIHVSPKLPNHSYHPTAYSAIITFGEYREQCEIAGACTFDILTFDPNDCKDCYKNMINYIKFNKKMKRDGIFYARLDPTETSITDCNWYSKAFVEKYNAELLKNEK